MAIDNMNPTRLARQARAQIDAHLERDSASEANPQRIEASLLILGRMAHLIGGRLWRQYRAQFEAHCERDINARMERQEATAELLARAIDQVERRQALFG